jgi:hypothetical protein
MPNCLLVFDNLNQDFIALMNRSQNVTGSLMQYNPLFDSMKHRIFQTSSGCDQLYNPLAFLAYWPFDAVNRFGPANI